MQVYKFGGTSLGTAERMKSVADLITRDQKQKIVVLSAVSGTTDKLIGLSKADIESGEAILRDMEHAYTDYKNTLLTNSDCLASATEFLAETFTSLREALHLQKAKDEKWFVAFGEFISTSLFSLLLIERGVNSAYLPALDFMRTADGEPVMPVIEDLLQKVIASIGKKDIYVTQGYICRNEDDEIDNLRRGGSDYTATIIGAALRVEEIQIWTDIDGVHNNDPRVVKNTRPIEKLSYAEAAELAYFGAKILHPLCVRPARLAAVPIRLLNTLNPAAPGTLIHQANPLSHGGAKAVAAKDGITAINIRSSYMLMAHGFLRKIFEVFEVHKTSVDMITTSEVAVSLTIDDDKHLDSIVNDLKDFGTITVDKDQTIICVVGSFGKDESGAGLRILSSLKDIPIRMISFGGSESNISILISAGNKKEALKALNTGLFGQDQAK